MGVQFLNDNADFMIKKPENISGLYFPLASEAGLKSSITPNLGGDSKLDQESFLLEPVSIENLHNNRSSRNFWCVIEEGCWSAAGVSAQQEADKFTQRQDESSLTAGLMWQTAVRESAAYGLCAEITSFIPKDETAEVMAVRITNTGSSPRSFTPIAAVPIYGRSADNLRDHRNVTSMLHRIRTTEDGILVTPTMSFDEKGHRHNSRTYYVLGHDGEGRLPESFYPATEMFIGDGGSFLKPRSIFELSEGMPSETFIAGKEAMGGLRFHPVTLDPGCSAQYIILMGITDHIELLPSLTENYKTWDKMREKLADTKQYWQDKVNIRYHTGSDDYDRFLRWVSFQPYLRRIFGCSFLPHHDYGRGGRGWRDLWQDCLALLLMDPAEVHDMIKANFGGVRMDGTNATIIGVGDGSFIADRNGIARVWMDHALWPFMTTKLYIDQTGDLDILNETAVYFKDPQAFRGTGIDPEWNAEYGNKQKKTDGQIYRGTILEHLLVQHLTGFCETGIHNIYKLRGADWNDALDMASENGESVAFTCAYAGNLSDLARIIRQYASKSNAETAEIAEEISVLLDLEPEYYGNIDKKRSVLEDYMKNCFHNISGKKAEIPLHKLAAALETRAEWIMELVRKQEWIRAQDLKEGWFNSYYDNHCRRAEGLTDHGVRMMLTGQVFAVMSGTADDEQIRSVINAADHYLFDKKTGGYRLNTDFHELKFDMGRMFGFAYGEKENGAVFSHMTVMFANALYRRGFVREGYKALQTLADTALDFETSKIFPGIPEYFNSDGRGLYHYLTGAASWFLMTSVNEVFGVYGNLGDLVIRPKLVKEQFDSSGKASISFPFAGRKFSLTYLNPGKKDYGQYKIKIVHIGKADGPDCFHPDVDKDRIILNRSYIEKLSDTITDIQVVLE